MKFKNGVLKFKSEPEIDEETGTGRFTAYASVFGNVDSYGDMVQKGAFEGTLKEWSESGYVIPLYYGHDMQNPQNNIGYVEAKEDDHGLLVSGILDLEDGNGNYVYKLLREKRLKELSFGYEVRDAEPVGDGKDGYLSLKELGLHEVSLVPVGANSLTEVLEVKSALMKAGRVLSKKNEDLLVQAKELIDEVLESMGIEDAEDADEEPDTTDEAKSSGVDEGQKGWSQEHLQVFREILGA